MTTDDLVQLIFQVEPIYEANMLKLSQKSFEVKLLLS